ncbi:MULTISPECIES: hypothetical protein [unclassified Pseudomonas]|jgi:hypothetical protein|uniref:hypothetical protein n=1 Tax=unclassified Pseudomonas TaxID=196821 RepID=UPI001C5BB68C|nr:MULTISPECIES: hypothetical protein [unclassified Pseudomonas]MBW3502980.1 hypothetical protein [Pseudomonas sp. NKUCC02_KPG]MEC4169417.1 hypothetical protein [Pseudomonas sp. MS-1(2024)]MEC4238011.1 hypothetical protein [Pseudomonas sp. DSV-1]
MTTPTQSTAPDALDAELVENETTVETPKKPVIPAFTFPFKPSEFAKAKSQGKAYYQKSGLGGHDTTPGAPPHGTRKTMGKR